MFLESQAVAFVGVLSYTLYLIHEIVVIALYYWLPSFSSTAKATLAFAIAFAFAVVVHRLVEKPLARIRKRLTSGATDARLSLALR